MLRSLKKGYPALCLFGALILMSCHMNDKIKLSGGFVYSPGGMHIELWRFESKNFSVVYTSPRNASTIATLTRVTNERFIFGECPVTGECLLKEFDMKTGEAKTLFPGTKPSYIPESKSLFFYNVSNGLQPQDNWLYIVDISTLDSPRKVAKAPPNNNPQRKWWTETVTKAIQTSSDEVLFVGEDTQLWKYSISQSVVTPTRIENCLPQFFRSRTKQLVCYDFRLKNISLIDLNTKYVEPLPQLKGAFGLIYIPKHDVVIYTKTRLYWGISETTDIWAYSFDTQEITRVSSGEPAAISSGFWLED